MPTIPDTQLVPVRSTKLQRAGMAALPAVIVDAGPAAAKRFLEFFTANIRNPNTREAYVRAVARFCHWCEDRGLALERVEPMLVAAYIEGMLQENNHRTGKPYAKPSVKQHLAAIRMLFDWLVVGQVVPTNPASSVRGPKHVVRKGKTPVLTAAEAMQLIEAIDTTKIAGLRDRALIGLMVYSFSRVGAALAMNVGDYYAEGKRWMLRLHEKGGKEHKVAAHSIAQQYLDAYLEAAGTAAGGKNTPLFRSLNRKRQLTDRRMHRIEALAMIKRRARQAGLSPTACCHTFRATGITVYLNNGGSVEKAQQIAAHESPRTTKLYDRTSDEVTQNEIERIRLNTETA